MFYEYWLKFFNCFLKALYHRCLTEFWIRLCLLFMSWYQFVYNPLNAIPTKWSNTLKHTRLSMFDHFVGLAHKGLACRTSDPPIVNLPVHISGILWKLCFFLSCRILWKWSGEKRQITDKFFKDSGGKKDIHTLFWISYFNRIAKAVNKDYIEKLNFKLSNITSS